MVKQVLAAWSQSLEIRLDPEVKIAFPVAKWTSPFIEAADKEGESYNLYYRAAVLFCSSYFASLQCQNKDVTESCYNLVSWPKPWMFWAPPQTSAPEHIGEDTLAKVIALLCCCWGCLVCEAHGKCLHK